MKCPHCLREIHSSFEEEYIGCDSVNHKSIYHMNCPNEECNKMIIFLGFSNHVEDEQGIEDEITHLCGKIGKKLIFPISSGRNPAPPEVDKHIADDYNEACSVLPFSPKASAALSRRCLQSILREKAGVKPGDLSNEIQQVINSAKLSSMLNDSIDAIRNIGNYAAHPMKSTSSGEILDVEPGEAEWSLDVLESLLDYYYVQPKVLKRKKAELDAKLASAGKPPMK